jgi:glycosyltransferase involved in cell wall biosynthesis
VERAGGRPPLATFPTYTDLETFVNEPPQPLPPEPVVAWVGALQRVKNPEVLARAWRIVAKQLPQTRLVVVGDGPLRPVMDALARDLQGRVEIIPQLAPVGVARVLDRSTVLVLPSLSEGLPRVAIEAFTRGRAVVGSAAGGIPDIVEHERNGLLVPPGDADALAEALVRVLSDRAFAERLAAMARRDAKRFRWLPERYADAVRALVDEAMAQVSAKRVAPRGT